MTAVKLPGQMEVPLVVDHRPSTAKEYFDNVMELEKHLDRWCNPGSVNYEPQDNGRALAKLLRSYDESPTSQKWIDIQQLAREILK